MSLVLGLSMVQGQDYFPAPGQWEERAPSQLGLDSRQIEAAIRFAQEHESKVPRNQEVSQSYSFGREPLGEGVGPYKTRGDATGLIIYRGYLVAAWGQPGRVDMTHSVTKTFLSTVVGLAVDQGLIRQVDDPVSDYVQVVEPYQPQQATIRSAEQWGQAYLLTPFESVHNRRISWDHLLRQTSDWEGVLWGKADWADRPAEDLAEERTRARHDPGEVWEYNDVRVNALALAATMVWRRPLPEVLAEYIMGPIGASSLWHWAGYRNSWIVLDGRPVQAVSGGGHWGGGMFLSAFDQARLGYLYLRKGRWGTTQLISEEWINQARTPTSARDTYGYMNWFLNTDQKFLASAPEDAVAFLGNGTNMVYVDQTNDLVVVARWLDRKQLDGLVKEVLAALPN
ncbi:MAG: serine hydrolase [Bacteroidota bacterium]